MSCTKVLQVVPDSRIVTWISCNMAMRVDKCLCIFNCQLAFADLTLLLPVDVASKYLKEDGVELFKKDETGFQMTLLEIVDFTYNCKNTITSMTDSQDPQNPPDI